MQDDFVQGEEMNLSGTGVSGEHEHEHEDDLHQVDAVKAAVGRE